MDVIELDPSELVEIPVQTQRKILQTATGYVRIIQIEHRIPAADFEGAETALAEGNRRYNARVSGGFGIVGPPLAGQHVTHLRVAGRKLQKWSSLLVHQ